MKSQLFLFCLLAMMLVKTTYAEKNIGKEVLTDEAAAEIIAEIIKGLHSSKTKEEQNTAADSNPPVVNEQDSTNSEAQHTGNVRGGIPGLTMGGGMVSSSINSYKTIHHHRHHKKIENRIKPPSKNEWKANKITPIPQDESDSEDNALSMQLLFESNSAELTEAVQEQLKPVGKALASDTSDAKFIIEGHTDAAGDDFYNKVLSQKRAESVKSYFVAAGVNPSRFTTVGKGKSNLFDSSNPTSQLNRRVRLIAVK